MLGLKIRIALGGKSGVREAIILGMSIAGLEAGPYFQWWLEGKKCFMWLDNLLLSD